MARPLVLVFQELAAPTATPSIPDLNTVIVGPAYDLLDYPDDAASILLTSTYGRLGQVATYVPPVTGEDAVTVLAGAYPLQSAGSVVDHSSVSIQLRYPRVVLGTTNASVSPTLGTSVTTTPTDKTLLTLVGSIISFVAAGVQAGDIVTLTSASNQTVTRMVASVGEPNSDGLVVSGNVGLIRLSQNLPNVDGSGDGQWAYGAAELRIERELPIQLLSDVGNTIITFPEPGNDKLVVNGGIELDVALTPAATVSVPRPSASVVRRKVSYSGLYLSYRALRQDRQELTPFTSASLATVNNTPTVVGLGKIDARNPLAVGVSVALQNAGTAPIYAYGVPSNDLVGHASAREAMSTRRDLYCFVPLAQNIDIVAAYQDEFDAMANPLTALADGVIQKFRIVIGSVPLPVATTVYEGSISASYVAISSGTGLRRTLVLGSASTASTDVAAIVPGDSVVVGLTDSGAWQNRRGTHRVGHVNSSDGTPSADSRIELIPGSSRWDDTAAVPAGSVLTDSIELVIKSPSGTTKYSSLAAASITSNTSQVGVVMLNPTTVGGPYTVQIVVSASVTDVAVSLVGFAITVQVNGTSHTAANVRDALNAHAVVSTLLLASVSAAGVCTLAVSPVSILPVSGSLVASIVENDPLYNILEDTSALFLSAGVKTGDTIEFPVDPQNYLPDAYDGRVLTYTVGSVMNENRILIANGLDDTGDSANELPHFYARDLPNRYLDVTGVNKMNYRVRRRLAKDDQVLALTSISQSVRSKRCTITWPDRVQVSDLRNGALQRSTATVRSLAGDVAGYYVGCQVGGACAGLPSQHGLTNLGLSGINVLRHSQGYFSERQLTRLSDGGFFLMVQHTPGALPICIHQLTTDPTALETGELSVVKNVDFISKFFLDLLEPFIGVYNVTAATQNAIYRAIDDGASNLKGRSLDRIGPPLISGTVTAIHVSEYDASRIEVYFRGTIPKPLNTIAFHLVV